MTPSTMKVCCFLLLRALWLKALIDTLAPDYQTRDSSPNSTAGSDGGRDEGTEEELEADEQVDELDQEEGRPDDALSRAESDSDGQHTPQALPAWAPLEELPSAPAFTHGTFSLCALSEK